MTGYLEAVSTMHTRGVAIDEKDYIFTLMIVLDESPQSAYALAYDISEFRKVIGTEHEEAYLSSKQKDAETMLAQQHIVQLKELLSESFRAQVQSSALNLKEYKFSGQETMQILNNLLKSRIDDIDNASVKDVVSVIKTLADQGALDMGDSGFSRHFIQIMPTYNALCVSCGKEFEAHAGMGVVCPHCSQQYRWSQEENRFFPEIAHL